MCTKHLFVVSCSVVSHCIAIMFLALPSHHHTCALCNYTTLMNTKYMPWTTVHINVQGECSHYRTVLHWTTHVHCSTVRLHSTDDLDYQLWSLSNYATVIIAAHAHNTTIWCLVSFAQRLPTNAHKYATANFYQLRYQTIQDIVFSSSFLALRRVYVLQYLQK